MEIIKFLLVGGVLSLLIGQTIRLPLSAAAGAITITDILVFFAGIVFLFYNLTIKKSIKLPGEIWSQVLLFSLAALSSTILASKNFSFVQLGISSLFLVRFLLYFFLAIIFYNIVKKSEVRNWINLMLSVGLIFAILGFVQLIIFPDFSFLVPFGWDPHQLRLASTLLDPNFSGAIFSILISISLSLLLTTKRKIYFFIFVIYLMVLILTFSRSSYLAMIVVILTIGLLRSPRALVATSLFLITVFSVLPQARSRIIGAFTLDETSRSRLESWSQALNIFKDNPVFGVGFNTYRFTQAKYGFFTTDEPLGGHSGAGTDSSILLVAATTGIFGLIFYLYLIFSIIKVFARSAKSSYLHLASLASFLGLLVHSQFVNSLFFPQVMFLIWILVGLNLKNDT